MRQPRVSVLTTVYNRASFLAEAVESVLASTFTDFELIIVDDASTDDSWERLQAYRRDHRVRLERNPRNLGDYANRNRAAALARAPLLKYVDADDQLEPHGLATMVSAMEAAPEAFLGISLESRPGLADLPRPLSPADSFRTQYGNGALFDRSPLSAIFRREAFETLGRFREDSIFADWEMWHRLAALAPVLVIPAGLACYRRHDGQESSAVRRDPERWGEYFRIGLEQLQSPTCPLQPAEKAQAHRFWQRRIARWVLRGVFFGNRRRWSTNRREFGWSPVQLLRFAFARRAAPLASPLPPPSTPIG